MTDNSRASVRAFALLLVLGLTLAACGGDESPTIEGPATSRPATTAAAGGAGGADDYGGSGGSTAATTIAGRTGGADGGSSNALTFTFTVRGGSVDGPSRVRINLNQPIVLRVSSDAADEVHVHGYDKTADLAPGQSVDIGFTANIPGTFEVELEKSHRRITTLEVQP